MVNFNKFNNIAGWVVFAIATLVYTLTVEPTASLWDCAEFISVSYKLEVPHPPGAPLFLLLGRLFSFMAMGDVTRVAYWINMLSVIASGFSILFLFWSIVMMGRKLMGKVNKEVSLIDGISLIGAGAIGSLAYAFTDSFWFSAVEAEVYGLSAFFTAIVFWAILKWEYIDDERRQNQWLLFIAYLMGLSIGVHLLNLVTMPCLGLLIYFKKFKKPTLGGGLIAFGLSIAVIGLILVGIIPGLPSMAGAFEIYFINNIGLPYGSGVILFSTLLIGGLVFGVYMAQKSGIALVSTSVLSLAFIIIGYSSYALIVIRASYNPPINENDPDDIQSVVSYLKREQYGDWPLLYGPYFTAAIENQKKGAPVYKRADKFEDGKDPATKKTEYVVSQYRIVNEYSEDHMTLFPRAHSQRANHPEIYRKLMGLKKGEKPSFAKNIYYMITHQFGHFYARYFMWNFAGRASDHQDADWLSPFENDTGVSEIIANNKARNQYFALPIILGLLGLFYQVQKDEKSFIVIGIFFIMTGIAITFYLNPPPSEPRERDYIYAGSFYAFAFWIGFGVLGLIDLLKNFLTPKVAMIVAFVCSAAVPTILIAENWDDHDRSKRYFQIDAAKITLDSTDENAILFTGGDNDTFPLWYLQEVEGFRTDNRVIVLTYFNTDWYLDQMKRQTYESEGLPFTLEPKNYRQGGYNDYLPVVPDPRLKDKSISLKGFLDRVRSESKSIQVEASFSKINTVPTTKFYLKIDKEDIIKKGIVPKELEDYIVDRMVFTIKGGENGYLEKKDLMILDLIVGNNWDRPIYFNTTSLSGVNLDLEQYVVQEGPTFRLLPVKQKPDVREKLVNQKKMYENLMVNASYKNMDDPSIYYNQEDYAARTVTPIRSYFNELAQSYLNQGLEPDSMGVVNIPKERMALAKEVILKSLEVLPGNVVPYDFPAVNTVEILFSVDEGKKAVQIGNQWGKQTLDEIYITFTTGGNPNSNFMRYKRALYMRLIELYTEYGYQKEAEQLKTWLEETADRIDKALKE